MTTIVSGIKPTGTPHLGNHLGMIRPALELAEVHDAYYFVADYHALNTGPDPDALRRRSRDLAATLLALGLDPQRTALYRQSDVPEVCELALILAAVTGKGLLNRAHAYKSAVDDNLRRRVGPDGGINVGLFTYPLLMAADILLPGADAVPVGLDQKQHVEITRDIAVAFNHRYGEVLTVPRPLIDGATMTVPGTDGRKMSKSYGNVVPVLGPPEELRRAVMGIVTDSRRVDEPKDPEHDVVFQLFRLVAPPSAVEDLRARYLAPGLRYADAKRELVDVLEATFREPRERYLELRDDPTTVDEVLASGAGRARDRGRRILDVVRTAAGLR